MNLRISNDINSKYYQVRLLLICSLSILINSCGVVTKKYKTPPINFVAPEKIYRDHNTNDSANIANTSWNEFFQDKNLQDLIHKALNQNLDYKNAILQIAQAQKTYQQSKLAFLPSLSFNPQVSHNHLSKEALNFPSNVNIRLNSTTVQIGLSSSWELDIWGKLASAKKANQASLFQSIASQNALKTTLVSSIASLYYTLCALDQQLLITEETISNRAKTLETIKALKKSAIVTGAAVVQAEANLYAAQLSLPDIKKNIREIENNLSTLIGEIGHEIKRSNINNIAIKTNLTTGVPLHLLQNRPDVQIAEMAYRRAFELTNVAKTQFYPALSISSAGVGYSALTYKNLFAGSTAVFYNLVGNLTQPIFNRGQVKTNYKIAQLQQEQALNNFQKAILVSGQEVSNALYAFEASSSKLEKRTKQIEALEKAVKYNMQLLEYSSNTNFTDVLSAEQALLAARLAAVTDYLQKDQATIELYRALGGGWK